jgi:uncharacterized protein (AIM24 family)
MVVYNIQSNGPSSQLVIEVINDSVYVEASLVAYVLGDLVFDGAIHGVDNMAHAYFLGKEFFKPRFTGSGKIYMKATLGSYHKFTLKETNSLIIAPNAFIACRDSIKISPVVKWSLGNFLSGAPLAFTRAAGTGNILIHMPGPIVELKLENQKFVAFCSDVAAYSEEIKRTRERAGKGGIKATNKMVDVYRGTGNLYFTPNPNKDARRKK